MPTKKSAKSSSSKMSKKDLDYFKKLLVQAKINLISDIRNMSNDSNGSFNDAGDVSGHVQHMADVATDMYDKEFSLGLASKERELLSKIEDALKRIEDGTYGICLGTGKPITKQRLKAIPYAEYCLEHQEKLESRLR